VFRNTKLRIPRPARPTTIYVIAAVFAGLVYGLHLSVILDTFAVVGATAAGTALITVAARGHPRGKRLPWYLLAGGELGWMIAWIAWQGHLLLASGVPPAPGSLVSASFVPGYVGLTAGLLFITRRHDGGPGGLLDVGIVASALLLVSWLFLIQPFAIEASVFSVAGRATQIAYLLFDVGLAAAFARYILTPVKRPPSHRLLGCAFAALLLADVPWNWLTLTGSYSGAGALTDGGVAMCPLLLAAAASASRATPRKSLERERRTPARRWAHLITMSAALLVVPVALVLSRWVDPKPDLLAVELGVSVVLVLLVVGRLARFLTDERVWLLELEQKRSTERALAIAEQQNDRLEKLSAIKDAFVATVSHELRTPLTSIRGYLELVLGGEAGDLNDEQRDFLRVVDRNSNRLLTLVGDLLFVAQIETGEFVLDLAEADLRALAADCVESAQPVALEKEISLTLSSEPLPPVDVDAARIGQVLDNLISNALKFTPAGGSVDVRLRRSRASAVLEVTDTGPGIPELEQQFLFERFFRTPLATDQAVPGTGLGLAIAQAIAKAHDGRVSVKSVEGQGSTFRFELPLLSPVPVNEPLEAVA
jgi:signal transduction histidine kinase